MSFFQVLLSVFVYGAYSYVILFFTLVPFPLPGFNDIRGYDIAGVGYFLIILAATGIIGFIRVLKDKKILFNVNYRFLGYAVTAQVMMIASKVAASMTEFDYFMGIAWHLSLLGYLVLYAITIFTTLLGKKYEP